MDDARDMDDQEKRARIISAHPPFLVATARLDPSEKNAINVSVHGLNNADFPVWDGDWGRMGAFVQVRQQERSDIPPDQFAVSIVEVAPTLGTNSVRFRIKRLDHHGGWGQRLTVQILLFAG